MRDWRALVRHGLSDPALDDQQQCDLVAELAAHLEESCEALLRQGLPEEEAVRRTLLQVGGLYGEGSSLREARSTP